jgi:biotin synthase
MTAPKIDVNFLLNAPLMQLVATANQVREKFIGNQLHLCSIVNAKSGHCSEDCKFCAQSAHHHCAIETYPLISGEKLLAAAHTAKQNGAHKFGIVTSGNRLSKQELHIVADAVAKIKTEAEIEPCASLGALTKEELKHLKNAGLTRYHHNIETSKNHYPNIVTTHHFEEREATIRAAQAVGLEVCSGGIIGIGETWQDRIDMALALRQLEVHSVPVNIHVPVKGTKLENQAPLHSFDIIRTICIFRIILKDKTIKIAAGRETALKDCQSLGFLAGANGMLIGGYLTVKGRPVEEDQRLIEEIKRIFQ